MRIGFAIVSLFAYGGLQRDCLAIAELCAAEGHDVTIFTAELRGQIAPRGYRIEILDANGLTNPGRDVAFGQALARVRPGLDRIVGFNKLPGLDIYYSGDPAYAVMKRGLWRFAHPRFHTQRALERACFSPHSATRIIALSEEQREAYRRIWSTAPERFRMASPNLDAERRRPEFRTDGTRQKMRSSLGVGEGAFVCLAVGGRARTKGLDRAIKALPSVPGATLLIAGVEDHGDDARKVEAVAQMAGVADRVRLIGQRRDVAEVMAAADLLIHPARVETTGTVILEAVANGLPVVATGNCGFSRHVTAAGAGIVLPEKFRQRDLNEALEKATSPERRAIWSEAGIRYGADPWLSSGHRHAAGLMTGELW